MAVKSKQGIDTFERIINTLEHAIDEYKDEINIETLGESDRARYELLKILKDVIASHPSRKVPSPMRFQAWAWQCSFMQTILKGRTKSIIKGLVDDKVISDSFSINLKYYNNEVVTNFVNFLYTQSGKIPSKAVLEYFILGLMSPEIWEHTVENVTVNAKFAAKVYVKAYIATKPWIFNESEHADGSIPDEMLKESLGCAFESAIQSIADSKERLVLKIDRINRTVDEIRSKQEKLKQELSSTKSELSSLKKKSKSLQLNYDKQSSQLEEMRAKLKEAQLSTDTVATEPSVEVASDTNTVQEIEHIRADLESTIKKLEQSNRERDELKAEVNSLRSNEISIENRVEHVGYKNRLYNDVLTTILSDDKAMDAIPLDSIIAILSKANIAVYGSSLDGVISALRGAGLQNVSWYTTAEMLEVVGKDCIVMCNDNSNLAMRIKESGVKVVRYNQNQDSVEKLCRGICKVIGKDIFLDTI